MHILFKPRELEGYAGTIYSEMGTEEYYVQFVEWKTRRQNDILIFTLFQQG